MSQTYQVDTIPLHERKEMIAALGEKPVSGFHSSFDIYEGQRIELPVVKLKIDVPVYRMANARTQTEQLAFIAEQNKPADFFKTGQDNAAAQQAQHDILKGFAHAALGSIEPIINELERTKQTEPLMITRSGVVINGNRRLAAMRELYSARKTEFPTFAEIDCMILPPGLTEDQIDDIETRLQERPETKLPYSWINEALKIRRQLEQKTKGLKDIAQIRRKTETDIKKQLSALGYAEIYLKDWKSAPFDYRLVEKGGEQFFSDLVARLKSKSGPLLEANLKMAWILFDNRENLGGRIYNFNKVLGEKAEQVLTQLAERLEVEDIADNDCCTDEDDLEIDLGGDTSVSDYQRIINVFDDIERREDVFDELRAVCQTILDTGQATKVGKAALRAAQDANTRLTEIDLTTADVATHTAIEKQLEEIIHRAEALRKKLESIKLEAKPPVFAGE